MLNDARYTPDRIRSPGTTHEDISSRVKPSANTRARLEKLAGWRIDPALLKFPNHGPNFQGGCAIVSRAFLVASSDGTTSKLVDPSGRDVKRSDPIATFEDDSGGQVTEGIKGEAKKEEKEEPEEEEHELDDEASGPRKLTLREAEFLVKLSHENIVKLEGFVEDVSEEVIWLVFPWEDNGNLKDFVALHDWAVPERLSLINILVNSRCRGVITDFGSAHHPATKGLKKTRERPMREPRAVPPARATFCSSTNTITLTGILYTTRWAAPEVLERDEFSIASDIWALGWVAYEVMTDSIPFHDVKELVVIHRVVQGNLPSISNGVRMLLIQELCFIMTQCWHLDPGKRPTAEDCQKSISWMPKITPNTSPIHTKDMAGSVNRRAAGLLMQQGGLHRRQSDYLNASKYFTKALEVYTEVGDRKGTADALYELARIHRFQQEYSQAVLRYTEALGIYSEISDRGGKAIVFWGITEIHRLRDEYSQAITFYSEALQTFTDIGNGSGRANVLWGLASLHLARNEYSQAIKFYSECLLIRTDDGDRRGRVEALLGLADVHRVRSEYTQAVEFYSECLKIGTDIGDRRGRAEALWGLAEVHRVRNEFTQAVALYSECLQLRTNIGDERGRASALWGLAEVHRVRDEYSQAVALYSESLQINTHIGDRGGRAFTLRGLAEVHRLQQQYSQAMALLSEAMTISVEVGNQYGRAFALQCMGDAHRDQHDYSSAISNYDQAAEIYKQIGDPDEAIVLQRAAYLRRLMERGAA
ncbi:hypothetical protein FS837_011821 [Tulasnella sp. UAMH 9824]|nr:hypothetical protein FS837_011821 [Tulasnella sp. UAMH 9824]